MSTNKIRLLIVDDQDLIRKGFALILETEDSIKVVGEARNGQEAVALAKELNPDVILMDIRMPLKDGLEASREILREQKNTRIIILTTFDLDEYVYEALKAGASGFLLKDTKPDTLIDAVLTVAAGEALLAPSVTRRLIEKFADGSLNSSAAVKPDEEALALLTERELEVLTLLGKGLSNAELADELYISPATAKTHVSNIMMKLGVHDRAQLVVLAYENGLVRPGA